jgi:hypothetical protein
MPKINSYNANYMARRAELFGIIRSNPNWVRAQAIWQTNDVRHRCSLSHVLHVNGHDDTFILSLTPAGIARLVSNIYNLKEHTTWNIMRLNDASPNKEVAIRAIRAYLLNKSEKRAWRIVNDASNLPF